MPAQSDHPVLRVGRWLQRAALALDRALNDCAVSTGLSEARFRVLDALSASYGAGCTQAELAARLNQSESHLSSLIEQLVDGGLLQRERDPQDRRKALVRRTAEGDRVWSRASAARSAALGRLLRNWSPEELEDAERILRSMHGDLDSSSGSNSVWNGRVRLMAALPDSVTPRSTGQER